MRRQTFFAVILSFVLVLQFNAFSQWERTNGPMGTTNVVCSAGDTLWVGTLGSVYMTTDYGENWNEGILYATMAPTVYSIIQADNVSITATSAGIFWFRGEYWERINYDFVAFKLFYDGARLWAAANNGVFYSEDLGYSWTQSLSVQGYVYSVFEHDGILFAGTQNSGIMRSTDNGATWEEANEGLGSSTASVYDFAYLGGWIYAAVNGWIYRSQDGLNWSSSGYGLEDGGVTFFYANESENKIYAATSTGVYWNTQPSQAWQKVGNTEFVFERVNSVTSINGTLFAATEGGVHKMPNAPFGQWSATGVPNGSVIKLKRCDGKLFAATLYHSVQYSEDEGISWNFASDRVFASIPNRFTNDFACTDTSYFLATASGLLSLRQSDTHWNVSFSGKNVLAVAVSGNTVYVGIAAEGVKVSHDGGVNWSEINGGLPSGTDVSDIWLTENYIFAAVSNSGLYRLSYTGQSWEAANAGIQNQNIKAFFEKDGILYAGGYGFFRSDNWGENWVEKTNGMWVYDVYSIYGIGNAILTGTTYNDVYITYDNAETWEDVADNLNINGYIGVVMSFISDDNYIYAGMSNSGVWRRPVSDFITDVASNEELPGKFKLEQNYPNPFNPMTTIKYSIPANAGAPTSLRIYNVLGKEIATLVNKIQSPGNYSVQFNASDLPSGVYYYTLRVGEFAETKKMLLLK